MKTLVRSLVHCAALAMGLAASSAAFAQSYPSSTVTLVVPFAAGSGTDAVARVVAQKLGERFKQPVVIDNKPGASAQIAALYVAKSKPDGYTLFMTTNTSHSANPSLYTNLKYDAIKDFTPVARVGELPFALVVTPDLPARNLAELLTYAKANPGKLSYATPNSTSLVASETINRIAGISVMGIPYKSSPQAMTDLVSGQVQMYVTDVGSGAAMIKAGKARAIGVTTANPLKNYPGVPPIASVVPGFDLTSWNGIFGPAHMPRAVVEHINTELQAVLADKEVQERLSQMGFEVWPTKTPQEFTTYVADQLTNWSTLIKKANIRAEQL